MGGGGGGGGALHIWKCSSEILPWGRFIDSTPDRINDESFVFGPIIFVVVFIRL